MSKDNGYSWLRAGKVKGGILFLLLVTLCTTCENSPQTSNPGICPDFRQYLPEGCQYVRTFEMSADPSIEDEGKSDVECVVFYRFDLPENGEASHSPMGAFVYRPDDQTPGEISTCDLCLTEMTDPWYSDYLCECTCRATKEDVNSLFPGPELVIQDWCHEQVTRLSFFRWDTNEQRYMSTGHFIGDRIEWERDHVTVDVRIRYPDYLARAQLARRYVHIPENNGQGTWRATRTEHVIFPGVPADPTRSRYPEKVVLALYHHYDDTDRIRDYFVDEAWITYGQCWEAGVCGCSLQRPEIKHVQVVELYIVSEENVSEDRGFATIGVGVICEPYAGEGQIQQIMWDLQREGSQWKITGAR